MLASWLQRFSTRTQFFIAIAGTGIFLVAVVLLGVRSYFLNNFSRYIAEQEQQRLQPVAAVFAEYYTQTVEELGAQGINEIAEDNLWRRIVAAIQRDLLLNPSRVNFAPELSFTELNLETLSGYRVFGVDIDDPVSVAILNNGELIATLSTTMPREQMLPIDLVFREQQEKALLWAGAVALTVAAIVAWLLATQLRKRLLRLRQTTQQIASGDYRDASNEAMLTRQTGAKDDIAELSEAIHRLAETLANTENQRRQFMADLAHELRTPLTILKGELEAVEDNIRQPDKAFCKLLLAQTEHLNHLVEDFHSLAQAEALQYQWQSIDLKALLARSVEQIATQTATVGLNIKYVAAEHPIWLQADDHRLQQAIMNLLQNSVRYTKAPGQIFVRLGVDKITRMAWISIEDSAPSVAEEHIPQLFTRFYRVDQDRQRATGGSGLGLAIVAQIVHAHHGTVSAQPSSLGGLRVDINLPYAPNSHNNLARKGAMRGKAP
ncbi:hypothetical protein CWE08_01390 [Aliidiomarina iranensis]|uniref:histidine kinase n=1 Tax=Aliidiomarina iranensis TaxID=1434071 RepID=A0A432W269_9GAMM|nr:ATP-binding protein [Aliidiomarina iranensis]RUO23330.1 hypothetical protein CWE08_01390 [Aliidiomarina iranensis]